MTDNDGLPRRARISDLSGAGGAKPTPNRVDDVAADKMRQLLDKELADIDSSTEATAERSAAPESEPKTAKVQSPEVPTAQDTATTPETPAAKPTAIARETGATKRTRPNTSHDRRGGGDRRHAQPTSKKSGSVALVGVGLALLLLGVAGLALLRGGGGDDANEANDQTATADPDIVDGDTESSANDATDNDNGTDTDTDTDGAAEGGDDALAEEQDVAEGSDDAMAEEPVLPELAATAEGENGVGSAFIKIENGTVFLEGAMPDQQAIDDMAVSLAGLEQPVVNNLTIVPEASAGASRVVIANDVFFDSGSAELREIDQSTLDSVVGLCLARPDLILTIVGHTDAMGDDDMNMKLSESRAEAVRQLLISEGVPEEVLRVRGAGETEPIASNEDEDGRAQNRRIEFEFSAA